MTAIAQIATAYQGPVTMTSLELVDFINAQRAPDEPELTHANFLAKVPKVLGETSHFFECDLPDTYGRPRRGYRFPKREACLMAMSYSYDLQAKVFDRMTALESSRALAVPQTMAQALRLAADQAEQIEQQASQLADAAPMVEFVERYVQAESGSMGLRQVCKVLGAKQNQFTDFLLARGLMYRTLAGALTPKAEHIHNGRFQAKTGVADHGDTSHAYLQYKFTAKGVEWIARLWAQKDQAETGESNA